MGLHFFSTVLKRSVWALRRFNKGRTILELKSEARLCTRFSELLHNHLYTCHAIA